MEDTFKHQGLRKKLIDELRQKGIENEDVLQAMNAIPRHWFCFESAFLPYAYQDKAFQIGYGQTISQPYTVAFQSSLLNAKKRDKVLEIGTGSGYQTAVLAKMGLKVFSIERQQGLFEKSHKLLDAMNIKARCYYGDGYKGKPAFAPFDRILVTCGAPFVPEDLLKQLKVGGRMVIPVGEFNGVQRMMTYDKKSETEIVSEDHGDFQFVPMLERTNKAS